MLLPLLFSSLMRPMCHSLLLSLLESKGLKILNGGKLTIGSAHLDLRLGVFEARDIVVHSMRRELWKVSVRRC